jgi:hypothetical protein
MLTQDMKSEEVSFEAIAKVDMWAWLLTADEQQRLADMHAKLMKKSSAGIIAKKGSTGFKNTKSLPLKSGDKRAALIADVDALFA